MIAQLKSVYSVIALGILFTGCAITPTYDSCQVCNPFKVERNEILSKVKTIAIVPIKIPSKMDRAPQIAERYESLITAELSQAGFKVVPSKEYAAVWDPMVKQIGGIFDPKTGQLDQNKFKTVRELSLREMASKKKVDAFLQAGFIVAKARWHGNTASWHGTTEAVTGKEGFLASLVAAGSAGTITGSSLLVIIADPNDKPYYANAGGIQLLMQYKGDFVSVPESELFVDPGKDAKAVKIALAPLVEGPKVASSGQTGL